MKTQIADFTRPIDDIFWSRLLFITDSDSTEVTAAAKRKSGAGDATDSAPSEGVTPEKKAKISTEEKESTNGESEVASEGAGEAKNMSYQKHF